MTNRKPLGVLLAVLLGFGLSAYAQIGLTKEQAEKKYDTTLVMYDNRATVTDENKFDVELVFKDNVVIAVGYKPPSGTSDTTIVTVEETKPNTYSVNSFNPTSGGFWTSDKAQQNFFKKLAEDNNISWGIVRKDKAPNWVGLMGIYGINCKIMNSGDGKILCYYDYKQVVIVSKDAIRYLTNLQDKKNKEDKLQNTKALY